MADAAQHPRRRRWLQFGLRTLLAVVALATAPLLAWRIYIEPFRQQAATMALIEQLGGTYQSVPGGPAWLRRMFGEQNFQDVTHINLADCDAPEKYIDHIACVPRLRTLTVGGHSFDADCLRRLHSLKKLEGLVLDTTIVSERDVADLQAALPMLTVHKSHRRAIAVLKAKRVALYDVDSEDAPWLRDIVGKEHFRQINSVSPAAGLSAFGMHYSPSELTDDDLVVLQGIDSLEHLNLQRANISDRSLPVLASLRNLKDLDLQATKIGRLEPLAALSMLEDLHLGRCAISPEELSHLSKLPHLETLRLERVPLGDAGLSHLHDLANLRELDLTRTEITDRGLAHLAALKNLERLTLFENRITDEGLSDLIRLSHLEFLGLVASYTLGTRNDGEASISTEAEKRLKEAIPSAEICGTSQPLDLSSLMRRAARVRESIEDSLTLRGLEVLHLDQIAGLRNLKKLDLDSTIVDDDGLRHLENLEQLVELRLAQTWVTDAGLVHLAELKNLKFLDLSRTRVTDAGLRRLSRLGNLEDLILWDAPVTGTGLSYLAGCAGLEAITLEWWRSDSWWPSCEGHRGVTKEGLKTIATLRSLRSLDFTAFDLLDDDLAPLASLVNLENLTVRSAKLRGSALAHLRGLPNLSRLAIYDAALTDEAVDHLGSLRKLGELAIPREEKITPQGFKRLRALLPAGCVLNAPSR